MLHKIDAEQLGPRGPAMATAVGTCVHCGFCLPACPTYQVLESEMDSPRGRIMLMKSVLEGELTAQQAAPHIDRCLGCLACVTHCPSGVAYGDLISSYRSHTRSSQGFDLREFLAGQTLPHVGRFRWAMRLGKVGLKLRKLVPKSLRPMVDMIPRELPEQLQLPELTPAIGKRQGRVALLAGCAQQVLAPDINLSAIRVLSHNGIEVVVPRGQGCCGALSWHTGRGDEAVRMAESTIKSIPHDVDCLITTAAGCGSAIHEYPLVMAGHAQLEQAKSLAHKSLDISVYLQQLKLAPIRPLSSPKKVAYHDACHLAHAQKVRAAPRELLKQIPGVEVVDLADCDTCCGSAGTYNIQQPEIAAELGRRKAENALRTGASMVVSGNIGCLVQIEKYLRQFSDRVAVLHTIQIIDRAYRELLG
jgi:glycolate oxidase iron-sulfur subunit